MSQTLQRWLNLLPVSRLTRSRGYISVPAVDGVFNSTSYSILHRMFKFNATILPNNFSLDLESVEGIFGDQPMVWYVAYNNGVVIPDTELPMYELVRYRLNNTGLTSVGVDYTTPEFWPMYEGQVLPGKALRLEMWSPISSIDSSFSYAFDGGQLLTSILGDTDTRQGETYQVCAPATTVTDFVMATANGGGDFPFNFFNEALEAGFPNSNFRPRT